MEIFEGIELDDSIKETLQARFQEQTSGLISKKDELLGKQVKTKTQLRELEERQKGLFDKLGINSYDDIDELTSRLHGDANQPQKSELELKRLQRQLDEIGKEKENYYNQLSSTVIDNQLKAEFLKGGVKPELVDALALQFKNTNQFQLVKDDNGNLVPANSIGLSPVEAVNEWIKTDVSAVWRSAPLNQGSGSQGAQGKGQGKLSMDEIGKIQDSSTRIKALRENGFLK